MSDREQAIKDVAKSIGMGFYPQTVRGLIDKHPVMKESEAMAVTVAVSQRERVIALERALRDAEPLCVCNHLASQHIRREDGSWVCGSCDGCFGQTGTYEAQGYLVDSEDYAGLNGDSK